MASGGNNQTFNITIGANMDPSGVLGAIKQMQGAFNGLKLPASMTADMIKDFNKLQESLKKFESIAKQDHFSKADIKSLQKLEKEINSTFNSLSDSFKNLSNQKIYLDADYSKIKEAENVINKLKADIQSKLSEIKIDFSSVQGGKASLGLEDMISGMERAVKSSKVMSAAMGEVKQSLQTGNFSAATEQLSQMVLKSNDLKGAGTGLLNIFKQWGLIDFSKPVDQIVKTEEGTRLLQQALSKIVPELSKDNAALQEFAAKLQTATEKKAELEKTGLENFQRDISAGTSKVEELGQAFQSTSQSTIGMAEATSKAAAEVQQLQQSTQYFFSLRNMINLLKRGIREAVDVVKELDAAMTETAVVVPEWDVSDMWDKLPEYTKNANALGATVTDMYKASTLYYQQGLRGNEVLNIASETMKMARIGGLEAADATDKMTAALRGFNMEITEASAEHINDVYSNLAANTASNTEELGTAMQRTASIAASAGMSFEGTAAFLAQAIETTREPAENLGTAMKTIVARFTELKKNPLEISEVDGEEVSYNKVDTALQSIGVSLKDTNGQFRNLDEVFLDIAQRWNTLTQTQQRYIATQAAGSRQQSRFIAMMSNYDRTVELMNYANDSAGASNEQFEKTMDSLEAKINQLRNAWNEFLMGIANNSIVKGAVSGLTTVIGGVNKLINTLSGGSGVIKSALSLFTAFTGLRAGGRIINRLIGGLGGLIDPTSSFGAGFKSGAIKQGQTGTAQAKAISDPIVQAVNRIYGALTGKQATQGVQSNNTADFKKFREANSNMRDYLGGIKAGADISLSQAYGKISGLDNRQQKAVLQQLPGLQLSLQKEGIRFDTKGISKESEQFVNTFVDATNKGLKDKSISTQEALQIFGTPQQFKSAMSGMGPQYAKAASEILFDKETYDKTYAELWESYQDAEHWAGYSTDEELEARSKQLEAEIAEKARLAAEAKGEENFANRAKVMASAGMQAANAIASVGQTATIAGQGVAQLGMQLTNAGFAEAGQMVSNLGYQISSLGMIASSVGSIIGKVTSAEGSGGTFLGGLKATALAHPYIAAATLAIGAIGSIIAYQKHQEKKAKESAEAVMSTYKEAIDSTTEKISTLTSAKDTFIQLARGVDEYGNNIGLTEEEYSQFLETSNQIASIAPELIRGYDAQGHAIIATGNALDQLIKKQEDLQESARDTLITNSSINDLMAGVRVSDAFKDIQNIKLGTNLGNFTKQTQSIRQALSQAGIENFDQISKQLFGKEIDLFSFSNDDLRLISEHYNDILNLIESKNGELTEKQKEELQDAFSGLGEDWGAVVSELEPLSQAIGQYLSAEGLDTIGLNLGEEFTESFNNGLESLTMTAALEDWDASRIKQEARDYAEGFKAITQEGSEYADIMDKVTVAQEEYNDSIGGTNAINNYKNSVEEYAVQLENLADKYDDGTTAGQLFANSIREQAASVRNYAIDSVKSLGEALNTLSDEFASARGAEERFKAATEGGDYYTAAEGYKGIIDTILDEKNAAGDGSLTFWAGADELLGTDYVDAHSYSEVLNQVKKIQDCFADGSEGVIAFNDLLTENQDKLKGLGEVGENGFEFHLDPNDDLSKYAEALHMSEDALAALIDKARQWVPISLGDPKQIRQAIEASTYSMTGTSSKGQNLLYTSESQFRAEARNQGIRGDDYNLAKKEAQSEGVRFLNVENLTAKNGDKGLYADQVLENIGLKGADKTLDNAVAAFAKIGLDLEDTKQVLTADGIKLADGQVTKEQVEEAYNEQAYAMENPTVAGIANDTGVIASAATAMLTSMGILTDEAKQKIKQSTNEATLKNLSEILNPQDGFKDSASRNAARGQAESQLSDYYSTKNLLEQGGLTNTEQYTEITAAINTLEGALQSEQERWDAALASAQSYVDNIGQSEQEKNYLSQNALDIQKTIESGDANALVQLMENLRTEGDLSTQTMIDLGNQLMRTGGASSQLNEYILGLSNDLRALEEVANQPFHFKTKITGDDLEQYLAEYKSLSEDDKTLLLRTDIDGKEKTENFINEINDVFGDGSQTTKSVILQATAKVANGDTEGAQQILADAGFSEGNVQTITQKLSVICDGSVANPEEVKSAIQSQLDGLIVDETVKVNIKTDTDKIKLNQNATVNYKRGTQAEAKDSKAGVDYNKIIHQEQPETGKAGVSYNYISYQEPPETKHAKVIYDEEDARGRNFSIPAHYSLSFGAAAQGMNVPKKKRTSGSQVTALVGEEGFEIGYIPSEQRSVIFGTNGPEMTSFPNDTVIYPHDKSKEIIRRGKNKTPSFGSFSTGNYIKSGGLLTNIDSTGDSSSSSPSVGKTIKDTAKTVSTTVIATAKAVGKVSVWWENIARKTETTQRKADTAYSNFQRFIKNMQATLKTTGTKGQGNAYIKNMAKVLGYQQAQYKKANKELKNLDTSKTQTSIKYTSGKKQKTKKVTLGAYIKYDKKSGSYVIDQSKISAVAKDKKRGKAEAQAIKDAAEKKINDKISKRNKAEDAIRKAKEELDKFGDELYKTFFAWENELTKIWNITQKITQAESNISRAKGYQELRDKRIAIGQGKATDNYEQRTLEAFSLEVQQLMAQITNRQNLLDAQKKEVQQALSLQDERSTLKNIKKKLKNKSLSATERAGYEAYAKNLQQNINTQAAAQKYLKVSKNADGTLNINFDTDAFEKDKGKGQYTEEAAKAIQEYVKKLTESSEALNQTYNDLTNDISNIYDSLSSLQDEWTSYANDLWDISDSETQKELDALKKLSDSINDSLKNLLDEVKNKLNERRKQEDNAKTESDINKKQQRLAALRADTSGGHQVEIAQLEKEIADAQQDYQRTLEDQLLEKLQNQADLAEKQRERQIELQESIAETINNAALVDMWMANPEAYRNEIYEAFKQSKNYDKSPKVIQESLDREFESMMGGLRTNQEKQAALKDSIDELDDTIIKIRSSLDNLQKSTNQKTIKNLKALGLTNKQIHSAGFKIEDFIAAGIKKPKDLKNAGFSVADLKKAKYTDEQIRKAGFTASEFKAGTKTSGVKGANRAAKAGYSDSAIAKAYGAEAAMRAKNVNATGKTIQATIGTSAKTLQKIVNKSSTDSATQKDMAGVQGGKVDVNGKDKGGVIKDSHLSANGHRIGANKGSTLYHADWDEKTGKTKGKWTEVPFDKLTAALVKMYPIDAKQAITYAIKNSKVGSKLNKDMKSLVSAAGIGGKTYKLKNGYTASLGTNGKIYYADKNGTVQIWDLAAGKTSSDKYGKADYLKKAQKNNTVSREYAQALIKRKAYTKKQLQSKGVKKFLSGGLADFTGPAWLDGTPSKPELVLNATDTKNFLALKDVLNKAISSTNAVENTYGGDAIYEININVDKIEKDYDVDRVIDRVKKEITKGAGYRNVTQVRNFR